MNTKRILSLLLLLALLVALVGCGNTPAKDPADDAEPSKKPADDAGDDTGDDTAAPYKIVWYTGGGAQTDIVMVQDAMAEYCNETYGMNIALDIIATPFGDLNQKMAMVLSSGEDWDMCFTSTWANNYAQNVANGAYLALEDLLPQYAPELYDYIGGYWPATTSNGHIWAVPNIQLEYKYNFTSIPTVWVEMYNTANPDNKLDQANIQTPVDLNDFFYWAKTNIVDAGITLNGVAPKYCYWGGLNNAHFAYLQEDTGVGGTMFQCGDTTNTVHSVFDFTDYVNDLAIVNRWYNDGLEQSDIATVQRTTGDLATLQWIQYNHPTFKPGEDANQYTYWGLNQDAGELTFFTFGEPWAYTGAVTATLTSVNANCKNPEAVLKFMNVLNTDATLFNMLCFGIEGYHYTVGEDGTVVTSEENTGYDPNADWSYGNQFLAIPRKGQSADVWIETARMNETCNVSCAMGFSGDGTNVETQIANLSVVNDEYSTYFHNGALEGSAEDWAAYVEAYKTATYDAGMQDVIDELQSQVDAWMAANG